MVRKQHQCSEIKRCCCSSSDHFLACSLFLPAADTHAVLQPLVELEAGEYVVTLMVSDSGSPTLSAYAQVNVTVCLCDSFGDCRSELGAILGSSVGINFIALIIIMASIALLLCKLKVFFILKYNNLISDICFLFKQSCVT